ncbi:efflux transporter outer membrane subunit [Dechloromonas sp. HYN0024]|uniref:efflux transporter outer membrane subunit n=1 Tax=Dechloromonas sp. HYN0024 TaxID=2231055 RepID=UPI000E447AF8|nr:efflux transporter outer membrane subunit [Dechloromonas sp. HYN0024]AXS79627.1 efflux transporter outer membrane subunit [Dechloromonas sp. HYN0024]
MPKPLIKHTKIHLALGLSAALVLSGCAVGPDYVRPTSTLPLSASADASVEAAINPAWWTLFGDTDLNALIEQTLAANQDLQAAIARLEASEAAAREAGADYAPRLGLEASTARSKTSGETFNGKKIGSATYDNSRAALSLSYEIDLWGRLRRNNEAARSDVLASRFGRDSLRLTLIGQVTNEYLNLRSLDGQIEVTAQTLESRRQARKIVEARLHAGTASGLELAQADSALNGAQAQWSQLQRLRALSENQIGLLSGQPGLRISPSSLDKLPLPPTPPAGLPSALLEARPDIRQAEEKLVAANARIGVAKAAYYPTISLTGLFGSESMALSNLFSGGAGIWSAAIGLAMPVFDAGRTGARIDQATAAQKETLANYRKTVQTAFKEVNDAIVGLREYSEEEAATSAQVEAAQRALDLAQKRYAAGYSGYMDLLDAQRTLNGAQLQYLASRKSRLGAAVDLFKALGGGWVSS